MFQAKVNNTQFDIQLHADQTILVNENEIKLDIAHLSEHKQHIIYNNKSYAIEVVSVDKEKKIANIKVNNTAYTVNIKDKFDLLLSKLGMADMAVKQIKDIKAPMPGLVIEVIASVGQEVKQGDSLLILEAMKMENVIKSPVDGVIKSIGVSPADTVEKNQLLIAFE